jgi:hypothetical protein
VIHTVSRTIHWSGHVWHVRSPSESSAPGPNSWSDSASSVTVDGDRLRLAIVPDGERWRCAEVHLERALGYGTYEWVVASDVTTLDPHTVLGLFTYDWHGGTASSEIDIEFARWGATADADLVEFSVQPAGAGQNRRSPLSGAPPYACRFRWAPGRVDFSVRDGGGRLTAFTSTTDVFAPSASAWPFVNLWLNRGSAPTGPQAVELSRFSFVPLEDG